MISIKVALYTDPTTKLTVFYGVARMTTQMFWLFVSGFFNYSEDTNNNLDLDGASTTAFQFLIIGSWFWLELALTYKLYEFY